ncbi:MAG: flagellin [Bacteriovoracaceae bacterium]
MSLKINTNVASIQGQNALRKASDETVSSQAKLSSGQRITKAADDAAGLAISEKMKAEIRSGKQAGRNANDGISLVQVAEGGLNESSNLLNRMKELAMQAANDTLSDSDRRMVENEYQGMKAELDRIAASTEFGGRKLLNGQGSELEFQVGLGGQKMNRVTYNGGAIRSDSQALGVHGGTVTSKEGAQNVLGSIDGALEKISGHRAMLGSVQNRLLTSSNNLEYFNENMSAANSRIRDVDYALETSNLAKSKIISEAGTAVLAQANMDPRAALKLVE